MPAVSASFRVAVGLALCLMVVSAPAPAAAQLFDPYIIGMMAGPVSDGPSILVLKKRGDQFMSPDTLVIACTAGAVSGVFAHGLPAMAAAATGIGAPLGALALAGTSVFGCVVGAGGAATALGTQWVLHRLHAAFPLDQGEAQPPGR